jgi:outer membrane beta-barrel protein
MFARTKTSSAFLLALTAILFASPSHAQKATRNVAQATAPAPQGQGAGGDKLDVTDLEKKYWAAKDTDFSVVQNRLYSKANRLALTLNAGMYVGEQWSEGNTFGADLGYFFSERYGASLQYSQTQSKDNQATEELKVRQGGTPNHGKMKDFYGVQFNWVPFYAKMSVLNSSITYFDMSFSPGVGMVNYEQQMEEGGALKTAPAVTLDITQHYFINKYAAVRVDYKNRWFQEEVVSYRTTGRKSSTDLTRTDFLMLGVTLYY